MTGNNHILCELQMNKKINDGNLRSERNQLKNLKTFGLNIFHFVLVSAAYFISKESEVGGLGYRQNIYNHHGM